jgi:hypothetical protein
MQSLIIMWRLRSSGALQPYTMASGVYGRYKDCPKAVSD